MSWLIQRDVDEGRQHLSFSDWGVVRHDGSTASTVTRSRLTSGPRPAGRGPVGRRGPARRRPSRRAARTAASARPIAGPGRMPAATRSSPEIARRMPLTVAHQSAMRPSPSAYAATTLAGFARFGSTSSRPDAEVTDPSRRLSSPPWAAAAATPRAQPSTATCGRCSEATARPIRTAQGSSAGAPGSASAASMAANCSWRSPAPAATHGTPMSAASAMAAPARGSLKQPSQLLAHARRAQIDGR